MSEDKGLVMFKAYDIRTTEDKLPDAQALRLMQAIGRYYSTIVGTSKIVLGRDARLGVPRLLQMAIDVLPLYGLTVITNPLQVSTCQFYYSCMQNPDAGGIMFTASHNPGVYIGLKMVAPGLVPVAMGSGPAGGLEAIRDLYVKNAGLVQSASKGKLEIHRYLDSYIDYSMSLAGVKKDSLKGLTVLADFLCGAVGTEIAEALGYAGIDLTTRNIVPNGRFPIGDPNPIVLSSIQPTWDLIKAGSFDYGFAYDGDGDRMDFMTGRGEQLAPSFIFSILMPEIKKIYSPVFPEITAYSDLKVNPVAQSLVAKSANVRMIRNGHSFIKEALREGLSEGCVTACEESGHYYMNFPYNRKDFSQGFAAVENTLFFSLLTSRLFFEKKALFDEALKIQGSTFRAREWPVCFKSATEMENTLKEVKKVFASEGLAVFERAEDGSDLDATLMRKGIPQTISRDTNFDGAWYQVAQRISRSEDRIARWEITASNQEEVDYAKEKVLALTNPIVKDGRAEYL